VGTGEGVSVGGSVSVGVGSAVFVGAGVGVLVGEGVCVGAGLAVFVGIGEGLELRLGVGELQPKRVKPTAASATSTTGLILGTFSSISISKNQSAALRPPCYSITH
jgi:hypothetical protein